MGSFFAKNSFQGRAWGPQQRPVPKFTKNVARVQGCSAKSSTVSPAPEGKSHLSQRWKAPQSSPRSACDSRSYSVKPQLTEPQQPATAEVRLWGSPQEQDTVRGHCIGLPGGCRQRNKYKGPRWGHTATQRNIFSPDGTHSLLSPHPQPHLQCRDHRRGHTARCCISHNPKPEHTSMAIFETFH